MWHSSLLQKADFSHSVGWPLTMAMGQVWDHTANKCVINTSMDRKEKGALNLRQGRHLEMGSKVTCFNVFKVSSYIDILLYAKGWLRAGHQQGCTETIHANSFY